MYFQTKTIQMHNLKKTLKQTYLEYNNSLTLLYKCIAVEFISIQIIQHEGRDGERAGASPGSCYKVPAGWYKRNIYKYPARLIDWCRIHSTYKLLRKIHGVHVEL